MIDFTVAYDKLASFETAEEIREFFRAEGVKAIPVSASMCAFSTWMVKTTGTKAGTVPRRGGVGYMRSHDTNEYLELTLAMNEFACNFDRGRYPELVSREGQAMLALTLEIEKETLHD